MTPSSSTTTSSSTGTSLVVVPASGSCQHEIRPGTTVCLHCRREARMARSERRRRTASRIGAGAAAIAVCVVIVNAASNAGAFDIRLPKLASRAAGATRAHRAGHGRGDAASPATAADSATPAYGATDDAVHAARGRRPGTGAAASLVVAEGRTVLRGGVVAVRAGDLVTVQFDTPEARTRRADKFESIVRATLPQIYGAAADSALAHVPSGALTTPSELVGELPARGLRLPLGAAAAGAGAIVLWPETRPGRDGPLVVSYRTSVMQ